MGQVSHSDLLGALSIVDDMRRNKQLVEENNFADLQVLVASKIRSYYAENNIAVDDALIASGVQEYLVSRFAFSATKFSLLQKLLGKIVIWRLLYPLLLGITLGIAFTCTRVLYDPFMVWHSRNAAAVWSEYVDKFSLATQKKCENLSYAGKSCDAKVQILSAISAEFTSNLASYSPPAIHDRALFYAAKSRILSQTAQFDQTMHAIEKLTEADGFVAEAYATTIKNLINKYPQLAAAYQASIDALQSDGDIAGSIDALTSVLGRVQQAEQTEGVIDGIVSKILALGLNEQEKKEITGLVHALKNKLSQLEPINTGKLEYYLHLAQTPLTLHIVDRVDESSGVTRTYGENSHAYYLVVEALDTTGRVFPLYINDTETGETSLVHTFGIRVPIAQYNAVKKDKLADGIIDHREIGQKKLGSITFSYSIPTQNTTITSW